MNFTEAIVLAVEKVKAWIQSGGVKWDHVSNKPFVKVGGDTLTWDGNTEGLVSVADTFYKVSDAVPTADDVVNGAAIEYADGSLDVSFTDTGVGVFIDTLAGSCVIVLESGIGVDVGGMAFPETGVYFNGAISVSSLTIPGYTGFAKEQIDPKFLPGAVVLYTDFTYLYSDVDTTDATKRITKAQLMEFVKAGRTIYVNVMESMYLPALSITTSDGVAVVAVIEGINEGVPTVAYFFTAEYTA